jgi:hypothetical protein
MLQLCKTVRMLPSTVSLHPDLVASALLQETAKASSCSPSTMRTAACAWTWRTAGQTLHRRSRCSQRTSCCATRCR